MTRTLCRALLLAAVLPSLNAAAADWPDLSRPTAGDGASAGDAAIVVGVENYLAVPGVPGAVQNAADWYAYFTKGLRIPPAHVDLLRNNEATLEKMRKRVAQVAALVKPGGTLWFVFIGHGAPAQDGRDGVLVGADAQQDADSLYARSLPKKELLGLLAKGAQKQTVVVLDACFSGRTGNGAAIVEGLQPLIAMRETGGAEKALVFSAGKAEEFAGALPGLSRPAFSYLFLGALRGWGDADNNGRVTAAEATDYVRGALRALVRDRNQTPELSGGSPSEVLGVGRETGPDIGAMVLASMPARRPAAPAVDVRPVRRAPSLDLSRYLARPALHSGSPQCLDASHAAFVDGQILKVKRIIQATPDSDAEKPDFHFRLGEYYADKYCFDFSKGDEAKTRQSLADAVNSYVAATKFPSYQRMHEVLFKLSSLLMVAKKEPQARESFMRLLKGYPMSKHIPDAYLVLAEASFARGEMDAALKFYEKVQQYPKASAYPYATYKKGWCYVNRGDYKEALETFVGVLRMTQEAWGNDSSAQRLALQDEARKDIVRVYPDVGRADKASDLFKRVGGQSWRGMLDLLAAEYTERGRPDDAAQIRKGAR